MSRTIRSTRVFKDSAFPLACIRHEDHAETAVHGHDFHELVVVLGGHGHHLLDGEEYPIAAGDVFVLRGGMKHGYTHTDRVTLVNILYQPRLLGLPLQALRDLSGYHALFRIEPRLSHGRRSRRRFQLSPEDLTEAAGLVFRLEQELLRGQPGYRFVACAHLMHLIGFLSRCYSQAAAPVDRFILRTGEVLSYIEKHYREPITLRQLAHIGHMSESTLMRTFRHVLGRSPIEHVIRARVLHALDLLQRGDTRVTEAAFDCGFNDSNYFSRQFRKITGMTPRACRLRAGTDTRAEGERRSGPVPHLERRPLSHEP